MQAKKTIKIIFSLAVVAIIFFLGVILLNNHIERKALKLSVSTPYNLQVPSSLVISSFDLQEGQGDLQLVLYEDYSDIFSANFAQTIKQAQIDFPNRLKIAYRFYNATDSSLSDRLALAIICAQEQNKGLEMRAEIFNEIQNQDSQMDIIQEASGVLSLVNDSFNACINDVENKLRIVEFKEAAEKLAIYGAPTTFIGDDIIVGARPYENFIDSNDDQVEGLRHTIERKLN